VTQGRGGGAGGTWYQRVVFTNVGSTTCVLRGRPAVTAVWPDGVRRTLRSGFRADGGVDALAPADIAPGRHALLDFASTDQCYPAVHLRRPVFTLPGGGSVSAGDRFALLRFCDLRWSNLGLPKHYVAPHVRPGTSGSLEVTLQQRGTIRAGTTLRYVVTLRNSTRGRVVLAPCPGYTEGLYADALVVQRSFDLNCGGTRSISAGGHARFEMRLAVPTQARPGLAKLAWSLDTATGPSAGTEVTIAER
jgi:hypothetical protein